MPFTCANCNFDTLSTQFFVIVLFLNGKILQGNEWVVCYQCWIPFNNILPWLLNSIFLAKKYQKIVSNRRSMKWNTTTEKILPNVYLVVINWSWYHKDSKKIVPFMPSWSHAPHNLRMKRSCLNEKKLVVVCIKLVS